MFQRLIYICPEGTNITQMSIDKIHLIPLNNYIIIAKQIKSSRVQIHVTTYQL